MGFLSCYISQKSGSPSFTEKKKNKTITIMLCDECSHHRFDISVRKMAPRGKNTANVRTLGKPKVLFVVQEPQCTKKRLQTRTSMTSAPTTIADRRGPVLYHYCSACQQRLQATTTDDAAVGRSHPKKSHVIALGQHH